MAELSVSVNYESKAAIFVENLLKLSFPVWGIVAPVVGLVMLTIMGFGFFYHAADVIAHIGWIGMPLAWLALSAGCLLSMRFLSDRRLLIDRNGMQFPLMLRLGGSRYVPWSAIRKIEVRSHKDAGAQDNKLVFYFDRGGATKLRLSQMQPAEVEQMLLAIEMWGASCERDESIALLQTSLKATNSEAGALSYTTMWEEELRRRFSSTAFVPLAPGQILRNGSLRVVRQLSLGGLSAVYLCQLDESKLVVLKEAVVPDDSSVEMRDKARELFEREAKFLMKLSHPGIVSVLDYFGEAGRNYLMLEYVNGQDLRQYVKQNGPQKESLAIEWVIQLAGILKYLHEQEPPIIHRDISPDNLVLRENGELVVIDFGAANEFISKATGTFVGKQSFIAPEQFRGKAVIQSDIYAFGCTLYFVLTGKEPEALATSNPKELNARISDELSEFVVLCTQMEARDRYQSAQQMLPVLRGLNSSVHA